MLSYVHGVSERELSGSTVGEMLARCAKHIPDDEALVASHQEIRWTWRELEERAANCAAGLLRLGLEPGDRVGIWAPNCAEWVVAQFATAKAGLILVNVNPAYRIGELEYALDGVGCKALITAAEFKTSNYVEMLCELAPEIASSQPGALRAERLPELRTLILLADAAPPGFFAWEDVATGSSEGERDHLRQIESTLQFDDPINIQFTSGTTGAPKAATLTHHNIVNNAIFVGERMEFSQRDRLCIAVPLYHCFGMVLGTLLCVAHGATIVLPSEGFDAEGVLAAVESERCTAVHGVPTMFIAELEAPTFAERELDSLRTGIMAGAPCPEELMRRVMSDMHLEQITIAYGMTETGPVSFMTSVHDTLERRVETVGSVLPHMEIKIIDEEGHVVPTDTPGELLTRGYCVMRGYWGDEEKTAEAIDASGWMYSGDIATLDAEGYCRIVGRTKDMLIRGGENIFPREIEEYLYRHPKVEEVEVFGVPDERFGEEVCAWIKLRAGETASAEEMREFCREQIAHFKIPRYIRFVDTFPMTVTGKVKKFEMRDQMTRELAGDVREEE